MVEPVRYLETTWFLADGQETRADQERQQETTWDLADGQEKRADQVRQQETTRDPADGPDTRPDQVAVQEMKEDLENKAASPKSTQSQSPHKSTTKSSRGQFHNMAGRLTTWSCMNPSSRFIY